MKILIYETREDELEALAKLNVHYISTRTIGYNHIDIEQAEKLGIHVCNASYAPNGVADFTIMIMLMCLRQYKQAERLLSVRINGP